MTPNRELRVREDGDPNGVPVFTLHGTPGSRLLYPPFVADARANGVRLVAYDRAGYGGSTPAPGRNVGDAADEVRAIADALRLDRFAVYGFSGGAAPALGCAARLPDRVVAASVVAGVAPYSSDGLDWEAGTGASNAEDFRVMMTDRRAWEEKGRRERLEMLGWDAAQLRHGFASLCSGVDREALTDEVAAFLLEQMTEGLRPGVDGMRDDNLSAVLPWGFAPESVRVPVQVWHGGEDFFVPFAHGRWVAEHVPGAEPHLLSGEGHLSIWLRSVPEVHRWLVARF